MIPDSHCHLTLYEKSNVDSIVLEALKSGVKILHTIATSLEEFDNLKEICDTHECVYCSIGIHPCNVKECDVGCAEKIIALAKYKKIISIGETGLDYYHSTEKKELQKIVFRKHIKAAVQLKLPLIVHSRNAEEDTIKMLKEEVKNAEIPVILHSFASREILFQEALKNSWYISFSGIVTFKNATELQEIARKTPDELLLIETDAPYLAPTPMRGKKNFPHYIRYTMEFLKNLRANNDLECVIMQNFNRVFNVSL